ncbi:CO or xanthine dehydrogenase, FAD-binding subunit [Mesorhizobium albiziae]|uniref:CO or xanthine dehydrogenase, FAD-binding subunit n=1 Tax=Neomesorhizobium albiziae TaxID=335020 RepID=A0A1I3Y6T8_9HYPH|nr:xanthine dehydrogenase family protein subunit M [Mesorhizobium albiziae]GLS30042.1 xanthine dehydrogenase [Mesorhizobium albiziae]SFK27697.1 CO or xanthine dehydrogenase, FAD-binding subunit [Mesorhizobium albiziae]
MIRYAKPTTVNEALALLSEGPWRLLAGGTDFYPALGNRPLRENILDINGLDGLRGISETATHLVIGARTTWSDIVAHGLPPAFEALKEAAREVGSIQIQNTGTVAGNLCNASPAADGVPALMILDAEVELRSLDGTRHLALPEFILGNRRIALQPGEMVTAIRVPKGSAAGSSSFFKLGARRYLVISIAMAAARISVKDGFVEDAAISVGACSAVAQRLHALEALLRGKPASNGLGNDVEEAHLAGLQPIEDVRGSAEYRRLAAREIVARAVDTALSKALRTGRLATVAA